MARPARRRTDNVVTMSEMEPRTGELNSPEVTDSDVARRAFEIYCERGWEDGHDLEGGLRPSANCAAVPQ